jgi:membrane protein involved in colicin uptake
VTDAREKASQRMARWRLANPEKVKAAEARYRALHREELRQRAAANRAADPERHRANKRKQYARHAEKRRAENAAYRRTEAAKAARRERERSEKSKARRREYNDKPEVRERNRAHWRKHRAKPETMARANLNDRLRRLHDPRQRLNARMASRVRYGLNGKGGKSWAAIVGYTVDDLRRHLERQFLQGMTWDNIGAWQIDHIVPLSSFSFSTPDDPEFRAAWALTNLRPLWKRDNLLKHAKRTMLL